MYTWNAMSVLGIPMEMFLVFVGTLLAGSFGAMHYLVVHVIMGKPIVENIRESSANATEKIGEDAQP